MTYMMPCISQILDHRCVRIKVARTCGYAPRRIRIDSGCAQIDETGHCHAEDQHELNLRGYPATEFCRRRFGEIYGEQSYSEAGHVIRDNSADDELGRMVRRDHNCRAAGCRQLTLVCYKSCFLD